MHVLSAYATAILRCDTLDNFNTHIVYTVYVTSS